MTKDELIKDIQATFPRIHVQKRLSCMGTEKEWMITGGEPEGNGWEPVSMPDGQPIFARDGDDSGDYDGDVHTAFAQWIERRGFFLECEDGFWHLLCEI